MPYFALEIGVNHVSKNRIILIVIIIFSTFIPVNKQLLILKFLPSIRYHIFFFFD